MLYKTAFVINLLVLLSKSYLIYRYVNLTNINLKKNISNTSQHCSIYLVLCFEFPPAKGKYVMHIAYINSLIGMTEIQSDK